ncbi:hypothetical protein [Echinicola sp. 20G]|uniref:hypothetical protein n=1 Tax=Echinicola sp. 20G TaxID=2781961 RepID=UPI0019111E39|nr:hypothetical protein [Echinicola sp. 20G]
MAKKNDYLDCVISAATTKETNGYYSLKLAPGFGLKLNEERLKRVAAMNIEV